MSKLLWKLRCTYYYVTILETYNVRFCWEMAGASFENVDFDTTEDPKECVFTELSYWGD